MSWKPQNLYALLTVHDNSPCEEAAIELTADIPGEYARIEHVR